MEISDSNRTEYRYKIPSHVVVPGCALVACHDVVGLVVLRLSCCYHFLVLAFVDVTALDMLCFAVELVFVVVIARGHTTALSAVIFGDSGKTPRSDSGP